MDYNPVGKTEMQEFIKQGFNKFMTELKVSCCPLMPGFKSPLIKVF